MALTLNLSPSEVARLRRKARRAGVDETELVRRELIGLRTGPGSSIADKQPAAGTEVPTASSGRSTDGNVLVLPTTDDAAAWMDHASDEMLDDLYERAGVPTWPDSAEVR